MIWDFLKRSTYSLTIKKKHVAWLICLCVVTRYGIINIRYVFNFGLMFAENAFTKRKKIPLTGSSDVLYRVSLTDIDYLLHMNNTAYLKYAEFAQGHWGLDADILRKFKPHNMSSLTSALSCRYRRQLTFNQKFLIRTKIIYWNETKAIFKQSFINPQNNFLHCVVYREMIITDSKTGKKYDIETQRKRLKNKNNDDTDRVGLYALDFYDELDNSTRDGGNGNESDLYHCRNEVPESIKCWMESIDNSKKEARIESEQLLKEYDNGRKIVNIDDQDQSSMIGKAVFATVVVGVGCYAVYKLFQDDVSDVFEEVSKWYLVGA